MPSSFIVDKLQESTASYKAQAPLHVLEFREQVIGLEFSPYLWSHDLICIAFPTRLVVGSVRFQEEYEQQTKEVEYETVQTFPCCSRIHSISWSPESNLKTAPKRIHLAYSTADHLINVITSNVTAYSSKVLEGHTNYVNSVSFNPRGTLLASGSDDLTCRIWRATSDENYEPFRKFHLNSSVVSVKWHHEDHHKVLVAQKNGIVTFINVTTETALMSLRAQKSPLTAVDWSPSNSNFIAALSGNQLVVWNVTYPSVASIEETAQDGLHVKFFPLNEHKIASLGAPENVLKVSYLHKPNNSLNVATLKLATGLSFHQHLPYVGTAVDNSIYVFRLSGL